MHDLKNFLVSSTNCFGSSVILEQVNLGDFILKNPVILEDDPLHEDSLSVVSLVCQTLAQDPNVL